MHNSFETLQQRCRRYRMRRLLSTSMILLVSVGLLALAVYAYMYFFNKIPATKTAENVIVKSHETLETNLTSKASLPVALPPVTAAKDMNYNLHVDADYIPPRSPNIPKKERQATPLKETEQPIPSKEPISTMPTKPVPTPPKSLSMSVKKIDTLKAMQQLYTKEPSYAQALKIAQTYYRNGRYLKASLWAKKANILDRERAGAWILYAKSEYAKGHRQRAVEILRLYLANAHSDEGDALLRHWMKGE